MRITLIFAILLSIIITIFALSNNILVDVNFLFTTLKNVSMPLLLMGTLATGVLITLLFSIPTWWKNRTEKVALKKKVTSLSKELEALKQNRLNVQQSTTSTLSAEDEEFTRDVEMD